MTRSPGRPLATLERVRERLSYDQEAGVFLWRCSPSTNVEAGSVAGWKHATGYIKINLDNREYQAHRIAWLLTYGKWPVQDIDHINGVRDDNRISNLRDVSRGINNQNQRRVRADSISGLMGASRNGKRWKADIRLNGVFYYLGTFDTPEEAHHAYISAKRVMHPGCTI